ncbi:uncharacterized protein [Penaeus vannamei]|uniref:uncharacterized protein n=1 Tax=Penaeus vannamei TaxID=6689 RepID=UPI00387F730D
MSTNALPIQAETQSPEDIPTLPTSSNSSSLPLQTFSSNTSTSLITTLQPYSPSLCNTTPLNNTPTSTCPCPSTITNPTNILTTLFSPAKWDRLFVIPPTAPYSGNTSLSTMSPRDILRNTAAPQTDAPSVPNPVIIDQTAPHKYAHMLTAVAPIINVAHSAPPPPPEDVPTPSLIPTYFPISTTFTSTFNLPLSNSFATLNPDTPVSTTAPTPSLSLPTLPAVDRNLIQLLILVPELFVSPQQTAQSILKIGQIVEKTYWDDSKTRT